MVEEVWATEQIERLRTQTLDLGILRGLRPPGGLDSTPLAIDEYCVCLPASHPLAGKGTVGWSDLREERIILSRRDIARAEFDAVVAACTVAGFSPDIASVAAHGFHHTAWVAAGSGVTIIPAYATQQRQTGTVVRALEPRVPAVPLWVSATPDTHNGASHALATLAGSITPPRLH